MAKRTAGGGLELSPAETQRLLDACNGLGRLLHDLGVAGVLEKFDASSFADGYQNEEERRRQAKRFAAHVRWHVKRPHRSRSCQFCP